MRLLIYLIPMGVVVNSVLQLDSLVYICGVTLLARLIDSIPYWRYHDRLLSFGSLAVENSSAPKKESPECSSP
jgi:hypothetical protein